MCSCSASFNLAILFSACSLLTIDSAGNIGDAADGSSSLSNDPRCSPSLSVILDLENGVDGATSRPLKNNGTFSYNGIDYSADVRWTDGNVTYGCICRLRHCIRKCCRNDEVLRKNSDKEQICQKMSQNDTRTEAKMPDLRLKTNQMTKEIQHIDKLKKHFLLVPWQHNVCSGLPLFDVNPDENDKIILQANGSFVLPADGKIFPFWNYCIDWKATVDRIGILVCWSPEMQSAPNEEYEEYGTHYHVSIIVSILFLVATFLVYAITPELRNLYGKTLMCYVICLIIAYVFLLLNNYIYISPIRVLCISTDL